MFSFVAAPSFSPLRRVKRTVCSTSRPMRMAVKGNPQLLDQIPDPVRIVLTRESGKNVVLLEAVQETFPLAEVLEFPCIETVPGEHREALPSYLTPQTDSGWVVITSPEAASVFITAWRKAGCPSLGNLAAVGKATANVLRAVGLTVSFEPSKATGKTLVKEFPAPSREGETVLYPASAKASADIERGLSDKGYAVTRLNTYSTEYATLSSENKYLASSAHIVTFASPSAVKGWVSNVGVRESLLVACIGETSAKAARDIGFRHVHYPERPGIEGWISAICDAMKVYSAARL